MAAIPDPVAYACTPSSLLASSPCLHCLSEKEMLGTILIILATKADTTAQAAIDDSACFTCMSRKQMLQGLVTILGSELLGQAETPAETLTELACIRCANETQILAAILKLLCSNFPTPV